MSRPLRVEYAGAIYHVMCRGNPRQRIFHEEADHQRLIHGLESTVNRFGWELFSYVLMPNHFHLFLRTPQPSLSRGMQYLASGTHTGSPRSIVARAPVARQVQEPASRGRELFLDREPLHSPQPDTGYEAAGLPSRQWRWSSYAGYATKRSRVDWIAYDLVYAAWQGGIGGRDAETAYRRYVERGLTEPPENPFRDAAQGWLLGSLEFVDKIRAKAGLAGSHDGVPAARRLSAIDPVRVQAAVAAHYGVDRRYFAAVMATRSAETLPHGCPAN